MKFKLNKKCICCKKVPSKKKNSISLDLITIDPKVRDQLRGRAKELVAKGLNGYIQGRLGLIFDTTSAKKT